MMNQTLRCACGSKVIPAPVKCGTEIPHCNKKCGKQLACGHYCYYNCHYGDCKPCQEIVDKPCACGKKVIEKGVCSVKMFCQNVCKQKLPCGHECGQNCHSEDCLELLKKRKLEMVNQGLEISEVGCLHSCGKKRAACGHPCEELCHPETLICPLEPCKYLVKVACKCGNRTKFIACGCTDKKITKELPCEERCLNLQRFKALYEKTANKIYYPGFLVKFAKNHYPYLKKLELKLQDLLLGTEDKIMITVDKNSSDKLKALLTLLPKHYMLDVLIFKAPKNNLLTLVKTPESLIPQMVLSTYFEKLSKGDVDVDQSPFDAKIRFFDLAFYENIQELDKILAEVKEEYYAELDRNNKVKLYVWNRESIPSITKKLQKSGTGFSQFEVDEYKDKSEEEVEEDVVVTEEDTSSHQIKLKPEVQEQVSGHNALQKLQMMEEKAGFDDLEDEKGLECTLEREISVEESKQLLAASKERKNSALLEHGSEISSETGTKP